MVDSTQEEICEGINRQVYAFKESQFK